MAICFWKLCNCPSASPCPEHLGILCSVVNGKNITKLEDIVDALTHEADLSVVRMDADKTRLTTMKAQLEAQKQELEKAKNDIESQLRTASGYGQRKAAADYARQQNAKYDTLDAQLRQADADLAILALRWDQSLAKVTGRMIVPYVDPTGYCACYTRKLARLNFVNSLIGPKQARIGVINTEIAALRSQAIPQAYTAINNAKIGFSLTFVLTLAAYLLFGIGAAMIVLCLALLVMLIWLISLLLQMIALEEERLALQREIVLLGVIYYRLQQIPTCIPAPEDDDDDEEVEDENAWRESIWQRLLPPAKPL